MRGFPGVDNLPRRLSQPNLEVGRDRELVAVGDDPDFPADQARWGGVAHRPEPDGLVGGHGPGLTQRGGERRLSPMVPMFEHVFHKRQSMHPAVSKGRRRARLSGLRGRCRRLRRRAKKPPGYAGMCRV